MNKLAVTGMLLSAISTAQAASPSHSAAKHYWTEVARDDEGNTLAFEFTAAKANQYYSRSIGQNWIFVEIPMMQTAPGANPSFSITAVDCRLGRMQFLAESDNPDPRDNFKYRPVNDDNFFRPEHGTMLYHGMDVVCSLLSN